MTTSLCTTFWAACGVRSPHEPWVHQAMDKVRQGRWDPTCVDGTRYTLLSALLTEVKESVTDAVMAQYVQDLVHRGASPTLWHLHSAIYSRFSPGVATVIAAAMGDLDSAWRYVQDMLTSLLKSSGCYIVIRLQGVKYPMEHEMDSAILPTLSQLITVLAAEKTRWLQSTRRAWIAACVV